MRVSLHLRKAFGDPIESAARAALVVGKSIAPRQAAAEAAGQVAQARQGPVTVHGHLREHVPLQQRGHGVHRLLRRVGGQEVQAQVGQCRVPHDGCGRCTGLRHQDEACVLHDKGFCLSHSWPLARSFSSPDTVTMLTFSLA
jgi:hypothetical protein